MARSDKKPPIEYVDCDGIREVFARGKFFQRFQSGEFDFAIRNVGPALTRRGENFPSKYRDQTVTYLTRHERKTVAIVHQRAGDEFGNPAPGTWADPKYVLHDGIRYGLHLNVCHRAVCECAQNK